MSGLELGLSVELGFLGWSLLVVAVFLAPVDFLGAALPLGASGAGWEWSREGFLAMVGRSALDLAEDWAPGCFWGVALFPWSCLGGIGSWYGVAFLGAGVLDLLELAGAGDGAGSAGILFWRLSLAAMVS